MHPFRKSNLQLYPLGGTEALYKLSGPFQKKLTLMTMKQSFIILLILYIKNAYFSSPKWVGGSTVTV